MDRRQAGHKGKHDCAHLHSCSLYPTIPSCLVMDQQLYQMPRKSRVQQRLTAFALSSAALNALSRAAPSPSTLPGAPPPSVRGGPPLVEAIRPGAGGIELLLAAEGAEAWTGPEPSRWPCPLIGFDSEEGSEKQLPMMRVVITA